MPNFMKIGSARIKYHTISFRSRYISDSSINKISHRHPSLRNSDIAIKMKNTPSIITTQSMNENSKYKVPIDEHSYVTIIHPTGF